MEMEEKCEEEVEGEDCDVEDEEVPVEVPEQTLYDEAQKGVKKRKVRTQDQTGGCGINSSYDAGQKGMKKENCTHTTQWIKHWHKVAKF